MKHFVPEKLPFWFQNMNVDGALSSKEVAEIFGFKDGNSVVTSVCSGRFPEPDYKDKPFSRSKSGRGGITCKWKKSTILTEIERRKKLNQRNS